MAKIRHEFSRQLHQSLKDLLRADRKRRFGSFGRAGKEALKPKLERAKLG